MSRGWGELKQATPTDQDLLLHTYLNPEQVYLQAAHELCRVAAVFRSPGLRVLEKMQNETTRSDTEA